MAVAGEPPPTPPVWVHSRILSCETMVTEPRTHATDERTWFMDSTAGAVGIDLHGPTMGTFENAHEARRATRNELDPSDFGEHSYRDQSPCFLWNRLAHTRIDENVTEHRIGWPRISTGVCEACCEPIETRLCGLIMSCPPLAKSSFLQLLLPAQQLRRNVRVRCVGAGPVDDEHIGVGCERTDTHNETV